MRLLTAVLFLLMLRLSPLPVEGAETPAYLHLNLPQAVSLALSSHPDITLANLGLQSAQLSLSRARSQFLPSLDAGANARETYRFNPPPTVSASEQSADLQLSANLNLFNGFADQASVEEQKLWVQVADGELERQRQTLAMTVVRRYTHLLSAMELLEVAAQNLQNQQQQLQQIEAFQQAGTRTLTDLYQQQAATAQAEFALADAQSQRQIAQLELLQALNVPPETGVRISPPDAVLLLARSTALEAQSLLLQALNLRPDILAAQRNLAATRQQLRIAAAGKLPRLDVSAGASTGYGSAARAGHFATQLDDNRIASLGLSLNIPLFDRDQTRDNIARAHLDEARQLATLDKLRQQVALETGQALSAFQRARQQLAAALRQLSAARQALEASTARYQAGASTWVELSNARTVLVQAQSDEVRARFDLLFQGLNIGYTRGDLPSWLQLLETDKGPQ